MLSTGLLWEGGGWTTARAATRLYELTGVALVNDQLQDYLLGFLFSVALAGGVDVPSLKLPEKSADAAMALYKVWSSPFSPAGAGGSGSAAPDAGARKPENAARNPPEDGEDLGLVWDSPEEDLPIDLVHDLTRLLCFTFSLSSSLVNPLFPGSPIPSDTFFAHQNRQARG